MGKKYLTPFDKSMAELFGKAYDEVVDLFTDDDDEEEKQRKLEEDRKKQKPERKENVYSNITNYTEAVIDLLPAAKYYTEDTSNLTKQQQKDRQILGNKFQTSVFVNEDGTMVAAPVSGVDMEELEEKLKTLNHPSSVIRRYLDAQKLKDKKPEDQSGFIEDFVLGTSPLDFDPSVSDFERRTRKLSREIKESVGGIGRATVAGTARAGAFIPQAAQIVNKYGVGSLEKLARMPFEGNVDYDRLYSANTAAKFYAEEAEKFTKAVDDAMDVDDLNMSEKILMYTVDYAMPINLVTAGARSVKIMADVASDASRLVRGMTPRLQDPAVLAKDPLFQIAPVLPSPKEAARQGALNAALKESVAKNPWMGQSLQDMSKIEKVQAEIMEDRLKLTAAGIKRLDLEYGKLSPLQKVKQRLKYPQGGRRAATGAEYYTTPKGEQKTRLVQYVETPLSYEQKLDKLTLKKIMAGQSVVSAGAISGAWDSYFEGTAYQDMSYMMGLAGAFATPTATMRVIEYILDTGLANKKFGIQNWGVPKRLFQFNMGPDPSSATGATLYRPLNLATILYGFGKIFHSETPFKMDETTRSPSPIFRNEDLATGMGQQRRFVRDEKAPKIKYEDSDYARRITAMAMGVPIYKALFLDNRKKIAEIGDLTELEAATKFTKAEFKALEQFAKDIIPMLPKEYIDSYNLMVKDGMQIVEKFRNSPFGDKTAEYYVALEQIAGGIRANAFADLLSQAVKNDEIVSSFKGMPNLLATFRTQQQELQDQVGYIQKAMESLVGGMEKTSKEFIDLKNVSEKVISTTQQTARRLEEEVRGLGAEYSQIGTSTHRDIAEFLEKKGGMNLKAVIGSSEDEPNVQIRRQFFEELNSDIEAAYKADRDANDALWARLEEQTKDIDLPLDKYISDLLDLKLEEVTDFGDIANLMQNRPAYIAFGKLLRGAQFDRTNLSFKDNIDQFIKITRYNSLTDDSLSDLKILLVV